MADKFELGVEVMYDLTLTPTFVKSECTSPVGLVSLSSCIRDRVQHLFYLLLLSIITSCIPS